VIDNPRKPIRCALCKQEHNWKELIQHEGHYVCASCLKLMEDEGISFPENLDSSTEYSDGIELF
jgi:hypothetical protein